MRYCPGTTRTSTRRLVALTAAAVLPIAGLSAQAASAAGSEGERLAPLVSTTAPAAGDGSTYIVTLRHGNLGKGLAGDYGKKGAKVKHVYSHALQGFAAEMSPGLLAQIRADKRVASVEVDSAVTVEDVQSSPVWGLDRIDQAALPLSKSYTYGATGRGVTAYVLDTGVRSTHAELRGRVANGFDAVGGTSTEDCNGHGTHVAGTIAGTTYGVAKQATVVPVRVMKCDSSGSWSVVLKGLDWVVAHHVGTSPAVANMSIGGVSSTVDAAVANAIADGIVFVVSAGNSAVDACGQTPARVAAALTVGSVDRYDTKATSSSFGPCLDVFAPGVGITSASSASDTGTALKSGTSMAAPHVAGAAALWLEGRPADSPATVSAGLRSAATAGVVKSGGTGSPDRLLRTVTGSAPVTAPSPSPTTSVTASPAPTPTAPPTTSPTPTPTASPSATTSAAPTVVGLSASGWKTKGLPYAALRWSGATGTSIDVWRDGRLVATTANDGSYDEQVATTKGGVVVRYVVCEAASTTCSESVSLSI